MKKKEKYAVATILDPRYKVAFFSNENRAEYAKRLLLIKALKLRQDEQSNDGYSSESSNSLGIGDSPPSKRQRESIFDCYSEIAQSSSKSNLNVAGTSSGDALAIPKTKKKQKLIQTNFCVFNPPTK